MAALDFPDTPVVGQTYGSAGTLWRWDGVRWGSTSGAAYPRGAVGFAQTTASTAAVSAGTVVSPLAVNGIVLAPGRRLLITLYMRHIVGTPGNSGGQVAILANGAYIATNEVRWDSFGGGNGVTMQAVMTTPGTYNFAAYIVPPGGGTIQMSATPTGPAFMLVEDITYDNSAGASPTGGGTLAPRVRVGRLQGNQSLPSGAWTLMSWWNDANYYDTHGMWNSGNTERLTVPAGMGGVYMIHCSINIGGGGTSPQVKGLQVQKNTATATPVGGANLLLLDSHVAFGNIGAALNAHGPITLAAGDFVNVLVFQNIGSAIPVGSSSDTFFAAERIA